MIMTVSANSTSSRVEAIQALRGLAAMLVVFYHAIKLFDDRQDITLGPLWAMPSLHDFGAIGVDMFFVISGFAMAETVAGGKTKSAARFLADRFIRIIPLYWLLSLAAAALYVNWLDWEFNSSQIANSITQLPLWDGIAFEAPVLQVGWTLMLEWAFYIVVAFSIGCRPQRPLHLILGIASCLGLLGLALGPLNALPMLWLNAMWLEFAGGVLLQMLWRRGVITTQSSMGPAMLCAGLLGFGSSLVFGQGFSVDAYDLFRGADDMRFVSWGVPSILFVGGALLCAERARIKDGLKRARWWAASLRLGDMSYSLYLVHLPLFIIIAEKGEWPWRGEWLVLAMSVGILAFAIPLHYFVELPMLRFFREKLLSKRPKVRSTAAVA